ncbi:hypothetical protein PLANTIT3_60937 [Plantibacter sp. T3]|nr:hypothetical protein PLANTIT3_60937 [Plantibacter sp. T3]
MVEEAGTGPKGLRRRPPSLARRVQRIGTGARRGAGVVGRQAAPRAVRRCEARVHRPGCTARRHHSLDWRHDQHQHDAAHHRRRRGPGSRTKAVQRQLTTATDRRRPDHPIGPPSSCQGCVVSATRCRIC